MANTVFSVSCGYQVYLRRGNSSSGVSQSGPGLSLISAQIPVFSLRSINRAHYASWFTRRESWVCRSTHTPLCLPGGLCHCLCPTVIQPIGLSTSTRQLSLNARLGSEFCPNHKHTVSLQPYSAFMLVTLDDKTHSNDPSSCKSVHLRELGSSLCSSSLFFYPPVCLPSKCLTFSKHSMLFIK